MGFLQTSQSFRVIFNRQKGIGAVTWLCTILGTISKREVQGFSKTKDHNSTTHPCGSPCCPTRVDTWPDTWLGTRVDTWPGTWPCDFT